MIAVDVAAEKLERARELGATDVVDSCTGDPVARVRELTGGAGVDVAFEALGRPGTVQAAFKMARATAAPSWRSGSPPARRAAEIEITHMVRREIRLINGGGC